MNRLEFLKISGLASGGLLTGIFSPLDLLGNTNVPTFKLEMPEMTREIMLMELEGVDRNSEAWLGWLARLAASSIISALGARLVDKWTGSCYCNGTSCSKNNADNSNYSNTEGVYGYAGTNHRFVKQDLYDRNASFGNVSVPYLDRYNSKISNLEGPFLAGACWAANDIAASYGTSAARSIISPRQEVSNGGYRFDVNPCYPTSYQSNYGRTDISYTPKGGGSGEVQVRVKDQYDNLNWRKTYEFSTT